MAARCCSASSNGRSTAATPGQAALLDPAILRVRLLRSGLIAFFFQYLLQAGLFFAVPLFLSIALGLSAIDTGLRILPLSITLVIAAVGIPKLAPAGVAPPGQPLGFLMLFLGLVVFVAALDPGAGPEITLWPMLLAGLGIGALASQLGAVTVSALPDEQSGEVGGLQNTFSNLGISLGTALAGAILMSALTASFFTGIESNPAVPNDLTSKAQIELTSGVPFISDADLEGARRRWRGAGDRGRGRRRERRRPHRRPARRRWRCSRCSRWSPCSSAAASPPRRWAPRPGSRPTPRASRRRARSWTPARGTGCPRRATPARAP